MKKWSFTAAGLLLSSSVAFAGTMGPMMPAPLGLSGFFIGLGGSYNSVNLEQDYSIEQISRVRCPGCANAPVVATARASGSSSNNSLQSTFAPEVQAGYFSHFVDNNNFWGVKYLYQYINTTSNEWDIVTHQAGTFSSTIGSGVITGQIFTDTQVQVNHEMMLLAFLGRTFNNANIYIGAGPSLFGTQSNISRVMGDSTFSNPTINPVHFNIDGSPSHFSSNNWIWGGAGQIGLTYFLDPTWFLDFNYTYARTGNNNNNYSTDFSTTGFSPDFGPLIDFGTLNVRATQQVTVQSFNITINKVFSL